MNKKSKVFKFHALQTIDHENIYIIANTFKQAVVIFENFTGCGLFEIHCEDCRDYYFSAWDDEGIPVQDFNPDKINKIDFIIVKVV